MKDSLLKAVYITVLLALWAGGAAAQLPPNQGELARYTGLHAAAAARLDTRDGHGRTPLMVAGHRRNFGVAQALICAGANLNALDHDRYDLLMISAVANDLEMVRLAIAKGADTGLVTSPYDGTALIAAAHLSHVAVVQALIDGKAPLDLLG